MESHTRRRVLRAATVGAATTLVPGVAHAGVWGINNDDIIRRMYEHGVMRPGTVYVHSVLVNGKVVKHEHRLIGVDLAAARRKIDRTVSYLRGVIGEDQWRKGMNPEVPA